MGKNQSKSSSEGAGDRVRSTKQTFSTREKLRRNFFVTNHSAIQGKEYRYLVEHTVLIWLDASSNQKSETSQGILDQFRRLINLIETFVNVESCVEYLKSIEKENIFIVVSGSLGPSLLSEVKDFPFIRAIYIYCGNKTHHEQWSKDFPLVRGVFTNLKLLCDVLGQHIRQIDFSLTSISLFAPDTQQDLNSSNADFFILQLMKSIILDQTQEVSSLKNLLNFARPFYENRSAQLTVIDHWKEKYRQNQPVWWYTRKCFIYHMLRKAFQYRDYALIYHVAFFIRELHRNIKKSHGDLSSNQRQPMSLYRASQITKEQFVFIEKNPRSLLAFDDFVLTTLERQIAVNFAKHLPVDPNRFVTVIYRLDIDPRVSSIPFLPLENLSYSSSNNGEVLLSMNTIFSVAEIVRLTEHIYEIIVDPIDRKDERIVQVVEILSEAIIGSNGWFQLARVLIETKNYRPLEQIYRSMIDEIEINQSRERAYLQHELGFVAELQDKWAKAIEYYKQSFVTSLTYTSVKDRNLRSTFINLARLLDQVGDFNGAIENCQKAINILIVDDPTIIHLHLFMGNILQKQGNYIESQQHYEKARTILQNHFPAAEPILADIYHCIGGTHYRRGDFDNALTFYEKTIAIDEKSIGFYHPSSAIAYFNLATVYQAKNQIPEAIEYAEKALNVTRQIYGEEHEETKENRTFYQIVSQNRF